MSCSIHLGNYILVVQTPTPRKDHTTGPPVTKPVTTQENNSHNMGALDFELSWLRFLRDTEEEYQKRLTRNDKQQPLSIFEVNVDLFESYLLKVSGRALASTQHLNLNITSAMGSHLKIFDTQNPELPSEQELEDEQWEEMEARRHKRDMRRRKKRRITASFCDPQTAGSARIKHADDADAIAAHQIEEAKFEESPPEVEVQMPKKKESIKQARFHDSLNERDDDEGTASPVREDMEESHEDFARETIEQTQTQIHVLPSSPQPTQQLPLIEPLEPLVHEIQELQQIKTLQPPNDNEHIHVPVLPVESQTLREFHSSQLCPESIIKTEEDPHYQIDNVKIMIGDQSIDANFPGEHAEDSQPAVQFDEQDDLAALHYNENFGGTNPFNEKGASNFVKESSIVVSQNSQSNRGSLPGKSPDMLEKLGSLDGSGKEVVAQSKPLMVINDSQEDMRNTFEIAANLGQPVAQVSQLEPIKVVETDLKSQTTTVPTVEPPVIKSKTTRSEATETDIPTRPVTAINGPIVQEKKMADLPKIPTARAQVEVAQQTSERLDQQQPPPEQQEVILRFEVAVGEGVPPINFTIQEGGKQQDLAHTNEVAVGTTPVNMTQEEVEDPATQANRLEVSVGVGSDQLNEEMEYGDEEEQMMMQEELDQRDLQYNQYNNQEYYNDPYYDRTGSPQNSSMDAKNPSRLEVTLTAEPDKPIMVEVRGGEKQFLIQALTKHIYDILSQPHRLQMTRDDSEEDQRQFELGDENFIEQQDQDEEQPEQQNQVYQPQVAKPLKVNQKNINLKLRSLKKTLQKNPKVVGKQLQKDQQRNEQLENAPENQNSRSAITIEELDQSSKLEGDEPRILNNIPSQKNLPDLKAKPTQAKQQIEEDIQNAQNQPKAQLSNRSNSGIVISNLTASGQDEAKEENNHASSTPIGTRTNKIEPLGENIQVPRRSERVVSDMRFGQASKRTTEEAYADAKIREETRMTHMFESEIGPQSSIFGGKENTALSENSRRQKAQNSRRDTNENTIPRSRESRVESQDPNYQDFIKSRPETANFNQQPSVTDFPSTGYQELPPINNVRSSQHSSSRYDNYAAISTPKTPKYIDEENMQTEKPSRRQRSRRAITPEGQTQEATHSGITDMVNSAPAEIEHFSLPPLQPAIPMSQPNGYFQAADADYIMRQDSQTFGHSLNSEGHEEYPIPQVAYYEPYQPSMPHHMQQQLPQNMDEYYQSQQYNGGYAEQDQNVPEGIVINTQGREVILAEGYPMNGGQKMQEFHPNRTGAFTKKFNQHAYDLSRNHNSSNLKQQNSLGAVNRKLQKHKAFAGTQPNFHSRSAIINTNNASQVNQGISYPFTHQSRFATHKQLPVVKTKKRLFANSQNNTIYSINGGPALRAMTFTPVRSLSPLRRKYNNNVYYTSNFANQVPPQQNSLNLIGLNGNTQLPPQYEEIAFYSQSPHGRLRHSPYMSDDEFKILHDFYDIQCEPTGMHRGGIPLMRVRRINRPKQRTFNIFNFADDTNVSMPKALSSLQILYPQYQQSPIQQDIMSKTLATPSKWFDRFYQSTRNLNQTISNLHKQHSRKLRSYSVSSLSSGGNGPSQGVVGGAVAAAQGFDSQGMRVSREHSASQQPLFSKAVLGDILEVGYHHKDHASLPHNINSVSQEFPGQTISGFGQKKVSSSAKAGSTYMPPLHKIYTANVSHDLGDRIQKKSKLPPRPTKAGRNCVNGGQAVSQSTKDLQSPPQPTSKNATNQPVQAEAASSSELRTTASTNASTIKQRAKKRKPHKTNSPFIKFEQYTIYSLMQQ